jgi:DNA adenine methylase
MKKILVPPIKSQGIKTKLVPWILQTIRRDPKGMWIEPFMGTGVVGFNVQPKHAIFSDVNRHTIDFYNALKKMEVTPQGARKYLEKEGAILSQKGEDHYYFIRERFNKHYDPIDFLFLSRACFNGMIRFNSKGGFNVPFCRKPARFSKSYITKITNQITGVCRLIYANDWEFLCIDFRDLLNHTGKSDFVYCDPPYYARHVDYYNSWTDHDEESLFACLEKLNCNFILSTWHSNRFRKNTSIDRYWNHFEIVTKEHFYHVGAKESNRNAMLEALVLNYPPEPIPLTEEKPQLALALGEKRQSYLPKERKTKKKVPH